MRLHHLHREHIYHETQPADLPAFKSLCARIVCGGWSCAPTPPSSGWPRTRGSRRSGHARCRQRSRGAGTGASSAAASVGRPSIDPDGQNLFDGLDPPQPMNFSALHDRLPEQARRWLPDDFCLGESFSQHSRRSAQFFGSMQSFGRRFLVFRRSRDQSVFSGANMGA